MEGYTMLQSRKATVPCPKPLGYFCSGWQTCSILLNILKDSMKLRNTVWHLDVGNQAPSFKPVCYLVISPAHLVKRVHNVGH